MFQKHPSEAEQQPARSRWPWPSAADRAVARARAAEAAIEEQRAVDQRTVEHLEAQEEILAVQARADAKRAELAAARRKRSEDETSRVRGASTAKWQARLKRWWHAFVLVGAIVGVNIVAVVGQVTAFAASVEANGFGWSPLQAIATAAVIETIAIYVGWHAHVALIEGDSVFLKRASSYAIAVGVAALNYHHYSPEWELHDQAVMFGGASLLSPWLWAIHSRHLHRQDLRAQGLIDPRAPKFAALRWLLHRPETWRALKWAVRYGEQSPARAILAIQSEENDAEAQMFTDRANAELAAARDSLIVAQRAALVATFMHMSELEAKAAEVSSEPSDNTPEDSPDEASDTDDAPDTSEDVPDEQPSDRERPDDEDNRIAEKWIRERMRAGKTPRQRDIAAKYGFSNGWAALRVKAARAELSMQGFRFLPGNVVQPPTDKASLNGSHGEQEVSSGVAS